MRVADLGLRQVLLEAQPQHLALALGQHAHQALDRRRVLGVAEAGVLDAEGDADAVAVLVVLARAVERDRAVGAGGLARLEHLLERARRARWAISPGVAARPSSRASSSLSGLELDRELLQVARHAHRPALVAEVALELAEDGRDGEARERGLAARVEAVDRLQQPERGDLDQVVERLAAALVAAGELARERQEALHELLARELVAARGRARAARDRRACAPPGIPGPRDMLAAR